MPRPQRTVPELKLRRNGVYYAGEFSKRAGRTLWTSLRTRDEQVARERFAKYLIEGPSKTRSERDAGVTVRQVLEWYERDHVEPKVVDKDRQYDAIANLNAYFKDTLIKDVDVIESRAYAEARRRGMVTRKRRRASRNGGVGASSTIRRELNVLIAAANSAIHMRRMVRNHSPEVELPTSEATTTAWLTKEQIANGLKNADGKLKDFILLAYYTAARRNSIETLRKSQIDLKHGHINLQAVFSPLTKKRRPVVPIFPEIRPTIERLMEKSTTEYLFGTPQSFYRDFVELFADIGIEAHPHMLRHSRASHMLMDGEDIYKVAKLLGDTIQTVQKTYAHALVDYLLTDSNIGEMA
jgi:integrase